MEEQTGCGGVECSISARCDFRHLSRAMVPSVQWIRQTEVVVIESILQKQSMKAIHIIFIKQCLPTTRLRSMRCFNKNDSKKATMSNCNQMVTCPLVAETWSILDSSRLWCVLKLPLFATSFAIYEISVCIAGIVPVAPQLLLAAELVPKSFHHC